MFKWKNINIMFRGLQQSKFGDNVKVSYVSLPYHMIKVTTFCLFNSHLKKFILRVFNL